MNSRQKYRLATPHSGRQVVTEVEPDAIYIDEETGEEYQIIAKLVPLAPSASNLPRTPENLRECPHCGELVGRDLSDCSLCGRRIPPP